MPGETERASPSANVCFRLARYFARPIARSIAFVNASPPSPSILIGDAMHRLAVMRALNGELDLWIQKGSI
jgi:hypothetical protein